MLIKLKNQKLFFIKIFFSEDIIKFMDQMQKTRRLYSKIM